MVQFKDAAVQLAREAGAAIMDIYENSTDFEIQSKDDNSPLTKADQAANKIICAGLRSLEDIPIISEENKLVDYSDRKDYELFWLVDPLDGTKEFIKRNGEFTVNIALMKDHEPIMGVVYLPATDELYQGMLGFGAYQEYDGDRKRLQCASFRWSDPHLKIVGSRSHMNDETKEFIGQFESPEIVPRGSSLKFIELAKGEAHIYPRLAPTMEWDTAAAQIILQEAGGSTIQYKTKHSLIYNKENLLNPSFVAMGNKLV